MSRFRLLEVEQNLEQQEQSLYLEEGFNNLQLAKQQAEITESRPRILRLVTHGGAVKNENRVELLARDGLREGISHVRCLLWRFLFQTGHALRLSTKRSRRFLVNRGSLQILLLVGVFAVQNISRVDLLSVLRLLFHAEILRI